MTLLDIEIGAALYFSYHENNGTVHYNTVECAFASRLPQVCLPSPLRYAPSSTVSAQSPPSRTPRTSLTSPRSVRKGHRSVSSVSWGSLNHEETGTALLGWKIYEAGELSRMMVSAMGRPNCERSWKEVEMWSTVNNDNAYLDIITLVIVATLPE